MTSGGVINCSSCWKRQLCSAPDPFPASQPSHLRGRGEGTETDAGFLEPRPHPHSRRGLQQHLSSGVLENRVPGAPPDLPRESPFTHTQGASFV